MYLESTQIVVSIVCSPNIVYVTEVDLESKKSR